MSARPRVLGTSFICSSCGRDLGPREIGPPRRRLIVWLIVTFAAIGTVAALVLAVIVKDSTGGWRGESLSRAIFTVASAASLFVVAYALWLPKVRTFRCRVCGIHETVQIRTRVPLQQALRNAWHEWWGLGDDG